MTPRLHCLPTRSRTGGRRTLAVHRDEFLDPDAPCCSDPFDDGVQGPHVGDAEPAGRTVQPRSDWVVDVWNDLGPEAA